MKHIITGVLLAGVILLVPNARSAEITGFVGYSSMQVAPNMTVKLIKGDSGQVADIDETNFFGKYTFEGVSPGYYKLQAGEVVRELMIKGKDDEKRIDIDLSAKGGAMDYSGTAGTADQQTKATTGVKTKANNQDLANQIAGVWWGYSGSTERRLGLCPGGVYRDYTESSYSGGGYSNQGAAWGSASQQSGHGAWNIQGDTQSGVITVRYNSGETTSLRYSQINDPGCLDINGSTLCRTSASCE